MAQEFHLQQSYMHGGFALYVVRRGGPHGTVTSLARELVFDEVRDDDTAYRAPVATLRHDEAQAMMDELWRVGVRPSEGTGSAGSLRHAEDHIASLKAIAFKLVGGKR